MAYGQDRSINIPAANYLFFGAGTVTAVESWLLPYGSQGPSLAAGSEAGALIHVQRDGVVRRMSLSQTTPTVAPVTYTLEVFDQATVTWVDTGVAGEVAVGDQTGLARGTTFVAAAFDFIRIRVNKAPAEPGLNHVRVFVELA